MNEEDCIIAVDGLVKKYGEKNALDGINMHIKRSEMYAFLGPNGSGKTTIVRVLSTLTGFDSGTVKIDGYDIIKNPKESKAAIGVIQQHISLDKDPCLGKHDGSCHVSKHSPFRKKEKNQQSC